MACACGPSEPQGPVVSKEPISVRGWIVDVEHAVPPGTVQTVETEAARKAALWANTYVEVKDAPFVSGGVDEHGAFVLLDVPPDHSEITFTIPNVVTTKLVLDKIPGNADVVVPALLLAPSAPKLTQPVQIRMAAQIDRPRVTAREGIVAGAKFKVVETPFAQMGDRRDYPVLPATGAGRLPTVK